MGNYRRPATVREISPRFLNLIRRGAPLGWWNCTLLGARTTGVSLESSSPSLFLWKRVFPSPTTCQFKTVRFLQELGRDDFVTVYPYPIFIFLCLSWKLVSGGSVNKAYDALLLDAGGTLLQLAKPVEETYASIGSKYGEFLFFLFPQFRVLQLHLSLNLEEEERQKSMEL